MAPLHSLEQFQLIWLLLWGLYPLHLKERQTLSTAVAEPKWFYWKKGSGGTETILHDALVDWEEYIRCDPVLYISKRYLTFLSHGGGVAEQYGGGRCQQRKDTNVEVDVVREMEETDEGNAENEQLRWYQKERYEQVEQKTSSYEESGRSFNI